MLTVQKMQKLSCNLHVRSNILLSHLILIYFDVENEDDKKNTHPKMQVIQVFKRYWNNKFADVWKESAHSEMFKCVISHIIWDRNH